MPEVLTSKGKAFMRHPWTGDVVEVDADQVQDSLAAGMQAIGDKELVAHKEQTWRETPGMKLGAGLLAFERGLTGGLPDIAARAIGGAQGAAQVAALEEAHPGLSTAGELAGTIAGVAATGLGAGTAQLGSKVANLAGRGVVGAAEKGLPMLAGAVAREATLGGAMGLGSGISDVTLAPGEIGLADAAAHLAQAFGKGAGAGALFAGHTYLAKTAAAKYAERIDLGLGRARALRAERTAIKAEIEATQAAGGDVAELLARSNAVGTELNAIHTKAVVKMFSRAASFGIGNAVGGGLVGGMLGMIVGPMVLKRVAAYVAPTIGRAATRAAPYVKAAMPVVEAIKPYARALADVGPIKRAGGYAAEKLASTTGGHVTLESVGHGLATGAAHVASLAPDAALAGAMVTGGIEGAAIGLVVHEGKKTLSGIVNTLAHKVAPPIHQVGMKRLLESDLLNAAEEIDAADPMGIDIGIRALLPESLPQQIKDGVSSRVLTAMQYVQEQSPGRPDQGRIASGATGKPSAEDLRRYRRLVAAVVQPESVVESFLKGDLRADQVQAWQRVYPEALEQIRSMVRAETAKATLGGGKYSRQRAAQIATLMGDQSLSPRLYDPQTVARMQQMHARGGEEKRGPKPRPRPLDTASSRQTAMQKIRSDG